MSLIEPFLESIEQKSLLREPIKDIFELLTKQKILSFQELVILTSYAESTLKKAVNQAVKYEIVIHRKENKQHYYLLSTHEFDEIPDNVELTPLQKRVFCLLIRNLSHRRIAELLNKQKTSIDRVARSLVKKGILIRSSRLKSGTQYNYELPDF